MQYSWICPVGVKTSDGLKTSAGTLYLNMSVHLKAQKKIMWDWEYVYEVIMMALNFLFAYTLTPALP